MRNKILFDARDAKEQRIRDLKRGIRQNGDARLHPSWDRIAVAMREFDPSGSKLAQLLKGL